MAENVRRSELAGDGARKEYTTPSVRPYKAPALKAYGNIQQITEGSPGGNRKDGGGGPWSGHRTGG